MSSVIIRSFKPASDSNFIFSTCSNGVYYGNIAPKSIHTSRARWFNDFSKYLQKQLIDSQIFIACMQDDPNIILGYSVVNNGILQFVYTKELFRKQGIATLLLRHHQPTGSNMVNMTRMGASILKEHPNLFKKKKEENESNIDETY